MRLLYGTNGLDLDLQGVNATVLEPRFTAGLADEEAGFREAVAHPLGCPPLRRLVGAGDRVAVVIADGTRPLPSDRLLRWIFRELGHVPADRFTIIVGTGSHRANTREELVRMCGEEIVSRYRIINHDAHDPTTLVRVGDSPFGYPVWLNREYVEADKRVIVGFIEPHFMAGFSGGYKAVFPGVAGIDSIMAYHGVSNIGHPGSTWGLLEGNPTQDHVRAAGSLVPVDFCLNVTLNREKGITRFFCGDTMAAHTAGCRWIRDTVMLACPHRYPLVVTTNGGHPLDQNLYQSVKGMSAAAQIVEEGGCILVAARCEDGFPEHGNFRRRLRAHADARALLEAIESPGFREFDQWQAQILALIRLRCRVRILSELPPDQVREAHLDPIDDLQQALEEELHRIGRHAPVAVLPEGPFTIPYLPSTGGRASGSDRR